MTKLYGNLLGKRTQRASAMKMPQENKHRENTGSTNKKQLEPETIETREIKGGGGR